MTRERSWALCLVACASILSPQATAQGPGAIGLDHIPVAVRDLEEACATYKALGFALKPGRHHANGIRSAHVKLADGAGIELLTAPKGVDALSAHYVDLLRVGEGPAFVSFHARDAGGLYTALRDGGYEFREDGGITKLVAPELAFLFMVRDNRSATDRPEHFAHANGAAKLSAVWVATEHGETLVRLLVHLGGRQERRPVLAPDSVEATVVSLAEGEVFVLPTHHQVLPGRPVIGASFLVADLSGVQRTLAQAEIKLWIGTGLAERVVVEPSEAHGLWLEFRRGL